MFITFLKFAENRSAAPTHMARHNTWVEKGFSDGVFLCVGSILPSEGGAIVSYGESRAQHEARIAADPFVLERVVSAEIHEIDLKRTTDALAFLKNGA